MKKSLVCAVGMGIATVVTALGQNAAKQEPTTPAAIPSQVKPSQAVRISLSDAKWLWIKDQGQLGIGSIFKLAYDGTGGTLPAKATVVCELSGLQDANDQSGKANALSLTSFHTVELKNGKGETGAAFWSADYKATGTGKLRIYLVENIIPNPKPQRVTVLALAVGEVFLGVGNLVGMSGAFKIDDKEYKVVPLSNVLEIPAAAGNDKLSAISALYAKPGDGLQESKPTARVWRNREGKSIEAEFIELDDGKVTLRKKTDGKMYTVLLQHLSDADQSWVKNQSTLRTAGAAEGTPFPKAPKK